MNPSDSEMSLNFGSKARVFSEMPNLNNKLCRGKCSSLSPSGLLDLMDQLLV